MRWRGIVTLIVLARKGPHGAQVLGNRRTKLEEPAPYPLVGNIQTPLRKKILHIPIAQSEPGIEPNGASNDFRWKAVTFEGDGVHPKRLHRNHQIEIRALNVTMPSPRLPGRQELQRPADPRGLRSRLPALSLLKAIGVYSRTSEAGEESAYGTAAEIAVSQTRPPVATCAIGPLTFRTEARRSIDRELPGEARWWHAFGRCANSLSAPTWRTGLGCAMFYRLPLPVPVCADARLAPERFARLWRLSLGLAFVGPARYRRRAALSYRVRVWAAIRG